MKTNSDEKLIRAAQAGDISAFNDLVRRCRTGIVLELTGLMGNIHDAEDVAQEAFLRGYLKLSTLKTPYSFGGWVRQIARNIARNRLSRDRRFVVLSEHHVIDEYSNAVDFNSVVTDSQAKLALLALSRLSSKLRETARLAYLSSYSQKQVAHRLRIPLGTVKRRLWEGRAKMKKEVLSMSRIGRTAEPVKIVPEIRIEELPDEQMDVKTTGPGLYFGTILETGQLEICHFFDYPGGILTQIVQTQVVRKVNIQDRECFEVLIEHSDCEPPEPNILDYFNVTDQGFDWVMRVTADEAYPRTRFMDKGEELFPSSYSCGENKDYCARVVNLTIGDKQYGRSLAEFWGWENGTPAESFYSSDGRQILHRRYVGPEAPESHNYQYAVLMEEERKTFRGKEYRLWYDTVLIEK
ncbi:MAG: RNA polymerase sigma factor [Candidatus Aegiribacteria sp.]|nr:RNA polymerase sigma factor [Candidatus Aegiribacteria sp.]